MNPGPAPHFFDESDGQKLRIHTISTCLKQTFGRKIVKLSLDGGFTCPNRDGTKAFGGCAFCSASGSGDMASGSGELRSSVSDIDMGAQLDGLLNSLSGGGEVQSFTSAENTEVGAVQFALQTTAITAPAPAAQPEPAAVTLTFWQKLLKLFGLYKG